MAGEKNGNGDGKGGGSAILVGALALLTLGAGGAVYYYHDQASKAEERLQRGKDEYRKMVDRMKKPVEEYLRTKKGRPNAQDNQEDMMVFLDRKARQAQIPPQSFQPSKNTPQAVGTWKEESFTITLRGGGKESPIRRGPVVDFLRLVEMERRSAKTKNLQLQFAGDDFASATITISQFQPK